MNASLCRLILLTLISLFAWEPTAPAAPATNAPITVQMTVDGTSRRALVFAPSTSSRTPCPLVFVFHGHGGNMRNAARMFAMHTLWPEAIVVYPQGLNTPGRLVDPTGQMPGWQGRAGDQDDRDLKFFDVLLEKLRHDYKVDPDRIYATGHSNGGVFVYLLWAKRPDLFAAIAPSGAVAMAGKPSGKPIPVLHVAGREDALVKLDWQKRTIDEVLSFNRCGAAEEAGPFTTVYPSKSFSEVQTFIYHGGHAFPASAKPVIARFFKEHSRPGSGAVHLH